MKKLFFTGMLLALSLVAYSKTVTPPVVKPCAFAGHYYGVSTFTKVPAGFALTRHVFEMWVDTNYVATATEFDYSGNVIGNYSGLVKGSAVSVTNSVGTVKATGAFHAHGYCAGSAIDSLYNARSVWYAWRETVYP